MTDRPAHSPLGASGAERWMNCPGSVALFRALGLQEESDEPDYRTLGTSAHAAAAHCLEQHLDAWEVMGQTFGKHEVDDEMAQAIQVYLDEIATIEVIAPSSCPRYVEAPIDAPDFHPDFYGTTDYGIVIGNVLYVRDFKYGAGIPVDVEWNPQVMYYAYGLLRNHPNVETVDLGIVQPRVFSAGTGVRTWTVPADTIRTWADETLRPAMDRTAFDHDLVAGPHCRFCPAKLVCPLMKSLFGAAMQADPKEVVSFTDATIDRSYALIAPVKSYIKALEAEMFARLRRGAAMDSSKLVAKKSDRIYKGGAEEIFRERFGTDAYGEPTLKSPAQMERLSKEAKDLVHEWAFTPFTGLTVAPRSDKRLEVPAGSLEEKFGAAAEKIVQKQEEVR